MKCFTSIILILCSLVALGADREHGTLVRAAMLCVSPTPSAERLMKVERGYEMVVLDKASMANIPWFKVYVSIVQGGNQREVTGWLPARSVVTTSTPNGDQIIYGEAVDSERQAEQRGGRKGAAQDAARLYGSAANLFPTSPLAAEALWRAAEIRWQLDKSDLMAKPSNRELDPEARALIDELLMKAIIKKFPQTKWADLAAYVMIDNKLCGEWKGLAKCPEREAILYELYAREHPRSPKAAEALYNSAWRQAALVEIYRMTGEEAKSNNACAKAIALGQAIVSQYPDAEDWKPQALTLIFKLEHNVPVYGSSDE